MNISKALWLALQNGNKYNEIYSAVSNKKTFQKLKLSDIERAKLSNLTIFIDEQLKLLLLEPLKTLNKKKGSIWREVGIVVGIMYPIGII